MKNTSVNDSDSITPEGVKVSFVASNDTLKPPGTIRRRGGQGSDKDRDGTRRCQSDPGPSPPPPASPPEQTLNDTNDSYEGGFCSGGVTPRRDRPCRRVQGAEAPPRLHGLPSLGPAI